MPENMGFPTLPPAQKQPLYEKLLGALLGQGPNSELLTQEQQKALRQQQLMALSASLLQAGGPSPVRTSLGQAIGQGLMSAQQAGQQGTNDALQAMLVKSQIQRNTKEPAGPQGVQSTVIGEDGYFYTVDRLTGKLSNTNVKAAPSMRVVEQEGNTPFGVVVGRGPAGSVVPIGGSSGVGPVRIPTAAERAGDIARTQAGVELETKPEITKQTELAKTEAERTASLPGQLADIRKMRQNIEGLINAPGFNTIYGKSRFVSPSMLPGGEGANAQARLGQLDAQAFGEAITKMRGLGGMSNAEGLKVSAAYTRATNPNISEEEARVAWSEVIDGLNLAEERLRSGVRVRGDGGSPTEVPTFATEAEAEAAGLKPGTRVIIGGVPGTWQ
jgi:hypothetical protein